MTKVKICGITNLEDAQMAVELGADELGFNFFKKSPRYIRPIDAREIVRQLPGSVWKVGVFVEEDQKRILEIVELVGLDAIQLHGDEDYEYVTRLHRSTKTELIKAIRVTPETDLRDGIDFDDDCILLDSFSKGEYGGTGGLFDWSFARDAEAFLPYLYLAGGLSPENVADGIRTVRPYAVDACSRLESSLGKKDKEKVAAFIKAAKEAI